MELREHRDMEVWAREVGRSTRTLRGLERGERVGIDTLEAVAEVLGVADWHLLNILRDGVEKARLPTERDAERSRRAYVDEVGHSSSDDVETQDRLELETRMTALEFRLARIESALDGLGWDIARPDVAWGDIRIERTNVQRVAAEKRRGDAGEPTNEGDH